MNSVALNYLSLKYQKSTTSGSIDIGIRKFKFVAKTQFLCKGKNVFVCVCGGGSLGRNYKDNVCACIFLFFFSENPPYEPSWSAGAM